MALRSGRYHNLKHHKDAADQKRAAAYAKMAVLIAVAVQGGSPRPEDNPRLRLAIAKARAAQMSSDAIERAIKKGQGGGADGKQMAEVAYEGYAPGGVALVVDALTDNRNRTAPEIKKLFEVHGGSVGAPGCVAWQFKPRAVFAVQGADPDKVMELLLEGGADAIDIQAEEGGAAIIAEPKDFDAIQRVLAAAKLTIASAQITRVPDTPIQVTDPAAVERVQALLDALDDHPDVQDVAHNMA